jgi:hypothetical protein
VWVAHRDESLPQIRTTLCSLAERLVPADGQPPPLDRLGSLFSLLGTHLAEVHHLSRNGMGIARPDLAFKPIMKAIADILRCVGLDPGKFLVVQRPTGLYSYSIMVVPIPEAIDDTAAIAYRVELDVAELKQWSGSGEWTVTKTRLPVQGLDGVTQLLGVAILHDDD